MFGILVGSHIAQLTFVMNLWSINFTKSLQEDLDNIFLSILIANTGCNGLRICFSEPGHFNYACGNIRGK